MIIRVLSDIKTNDELITVMNKPEEENRIEGNHYDVSFTVRYPLSLHDQIREGGWEKVFELAGDEHCLFIQHGSLKVRDKVESYYRLLALSKVLNEGKGKEDFIYSLELKDDELTPVAFDSKMYSISIGFHRATDRDFSIDFAEKEWKIFYNAKE